MKEVLAGLTIFVRYAPEGDLCAEHDVITAGHGLDEKTFTQEELVKLDESGWRRVDDYWEKFV
jgi:hypothetical protein